MEHITGKHVKEKYKKSFVPQTKGDPFRFNSVEKDDVSFLSKKTFPFLTGPLARFFHIFIGKKRFI